MPRITTLQSSSTQLAALFTLLILFGGIVYGYDIFSDGIDSRDSLAQYFRLITIIFMVVCAGLFIISYYVTKRINSIVATAERIRTTGDLSQRIPIDSRWDDLSKLSVTLNHMLQDIEQAVDGVRTVSDNIAHDLRTPLARMRNRMEEMRATPVGSELCHESMQQLIRECDALLNTFQALLRISNIENGKRYTNTKTVSLSTVLADVVELYEPLAAEKNITFITHLEPCTIIGDKDLLFQLFANLCDNAVKYTPEGGHISLSMQHHKNSVSVAVCDTGAGVPDAQKGKVFQRFFRTDESRSTAGSGLGLSLVSAITRMHQGSITLSDNTPQGLCVKVSLPS
jgi:signal transduction histidine kinase